MTRADFDEFLKRQAAEKTQPTRLDPKQQLEEWRFHLDYLYSNIKGYLRPYLGAGQASLKYDPIQLIEDFSGPYSVQRMNLTIGGSVITFEPIGTMLIGSKGRVDVQGPRGTARLSLMSRKTTNVRQMIRVRVRLADEPAPPPEPDEGPIDWVWKIIKMSPDVDFIELTEDSFFDMIVGLVDA